MEYIRIILFVLAFLLIIATLVVYFKLRKELKVKKVVKEKDEKNAKETESEIEEDSEIPKEKTEKYVKIFTILTIITGVLSLAAIIVNIIYKKNIGDVEKPNPVVGTVILDINPVVELKLDEYYMVDEMIALDDDAKKIVDSSLKGKELDETMDFIVERLIAENFIPYDDDLDVLICTTGDVDIHEIETKVHNAFDRQDIRKIVSAIGKMTDRDTELAKSNNISACKAAYINSIVDANGEISVDYLLESSMRNLREAKYNNRYCDKGYFLEGDMCLKELRREDAREGKVCPESYFSYNNKCYKEGNFTETDKETCYGDFTLKDGKCVKNESRRAEGVCAEGEYNFSDDKCHVRTYTGDAIEYCRDSGRTMYEHKCLATKPTLNGKCLGSDVVYKGKCVNMKNDYVSTDWKCKKGTIFYPRDSIPEGGYKCYLETKVNPSSYKCDNEDFTLDGKKCVLIEEHKVEKVKVCETGYTLTKDGRCLDLKDSKDMIDGLFCDSPRSKIEGNVCIIYDIVDAKGNN